LRHRGLCAIRAWCQNGLEPEIARALDGGHTTNGPSVGAISPRPNCAPLSIRNALNKVKQYEANLATIIATNRMALYLMIQATNKGPHHHFVKLDGTLPIFYTPGGFTGVFGLNGALNLILFTSGFAGKKPASNSLTTTATV